MILHCYVDDLTLERLQWYSAEHGRTVEELAEAAIAEAANRAARDMDLIAGRPTPKLKQPADAIERLAHLEGNEDG